MLQIDQAKFDTAHTEFERWMFEASNGVPFTDFQHPFLIKDEIKYKRDVCKAANDALQLDKWNLWQKTPGWILEAVRVACSQKVSSNLLEHRYGTKGSSAKALYRVETVEEISGLEAKLFDFFLGGPLTPTLFGRRFNALAQYLIDKRIRYGII